MGRLHTISMLTIIYSLILIANVQSRGNEKIFKFRVYLHDVMSGPNENAFVVAESKITNTSPTLFGQVRVTDNPLTIGPNLSSEKLGRSQGLVVLSGREEEAFTMSLNLYFTGRKYKESTICIVGRNPITHNSNRELPIVGGTGAFRWARGFAISRTYSNDSAANYAVLEYNIYAVVDNRFAGLFNGI
ncbi:hypothetical protein OROMI_002128 [Orobanche minor]